jgi:guanosine-3',5'-bis(diphosphate) 3'-pyrophosphohydrolase
MHEMIKKARAFALKAHNVQVYGDIYSYFKHAEDVYKILLRFGFTEDKDLDLLVASFLHDVIEDTCYSYNDLKKEFNINIAEIVYCVTDELGKNRKEKKEKTLPKIRSNPKAVILKVADRMANVEFGLSEGSRHVDMYRKEYRDFVYQLRIHRQVDEMWEHLERLLFPKCKDYKCQLTMLGRCSGDKCLFGEGKKCSISESKKRNKFSVRLRKY